MIRLSMIYKELSIRSTLAYDSICLSARLAIVYAPIYEEAKCAERDLIFAYSGDVSCVRIFVV